MPDKNQDLQRVRVVCAVDGFEDFWIEYDVSEWTIGTYMRLHGSEMTTARILREFIPRYSIGWNVTTEDGTVVSHPGPRASEVLWQQIWDQLGVARRTLFPWFWLSALSAAQDAMALPKKSAAPHSGAGRGQDDVAGRDEGEPAA